MSNVKWIKLCTDVFDDEKIILIDALPECDGVLVIWFKLLCLAGKQNNGGVFMLNDKIAYTDEMLATIFRRPVNTVRLALKTFEDFGMIEIINNTITIPNWDKHQNLQQLEKAREQTRKRVAKYREKQKLKTLNELTGICVYCGRTGANTRDHIIPRSKGGTDAPENIVECCQECNSAKCDRELADFLNNSVHLRTVGADIDGILANPKLNKYVDFDGGKFISIGNALRNKKITATDKKRKEEEKIRKEKEEDVVVATTDGGDEIKKLAMFGGKFAGVMLTEEQNEILLNLFDLPTYDYYLSKLSKSIAAGGKYNGHYKTIMKWYNEDRAVTS